MVADHQTALFHSRDYRPSSVQIPHKEQSSDSDSDNNLKLLIILFLLIWKVKLIMEPLL